jgi:DNA (cytosine-5)-methyltransferase 1
MTTEQTVQATIGALPRLLPAKHAYKFEGKKFSHTPADSGVLDHSPRFHSLRDQAIFRDLAEDAQKANPSYSNVTALQRLYTERTGRTSAVHKYYVLRRDEPSNLIPAHLFKDGLRHIHFDPEQARSITVREAAMLQGFPADFTFVGSQGDKYKMIGNAVPPLFSRKLALAVEELITEKGDRSNDEVSVEKQLSEKAFG